MFTRLVIEESDDPTSFLLFVVQQQCVYYNYNLTTGGLVAWPSHWEHSERSGSCGLVMDGCLWAGCHLQ